MSSSTADALLTFEIITAGYGRDHIVLRNFSMSIAAGSTVALVGESGSGKSTVARVACQLLRPWQGAVHFDKHNLCHLRGSALRRHRAPMQMVFQDPSTALNPRLRLGASIAEPLRHLQGLKPQACRERVAALLEEVGLPADFAERWPHEVSGGQRQRAVIARALAPGPQLLICDEAVSALDVSVQAQVLNLLHELRQKHQLTLLFITHDLAVVRAIADRVVVMEHGAIVEDAACETLFAHPRHPYTKKLLKAVPQPNATWMQQQQMRSTGWFTGLAADQRNAPTPTGRPTPTGMPAPTTTTEPSLPESQDGEPPNATTTNSTGADQPPKADPTPPPS
jgi:peptide/nickel transport system ATP-binding protein